MSTTQTKMDEQYYFMLLIIVRNINKNKIENNFWFWGGFNGFVDKEQR